jgi:hypothetical protein
MVLMKLSASILFGDDAFLFSQDALCFLVSLSGAGIIRAIRDLKVEPQETK